MLIDDTDGYQGLFIPRVGTEIINIRDSKAEIEEVILLTAPDHVKVIINTKKTKSTKGAVSYR